MSRIRSVKPELLSTAAVARLSDGAFRLLIGAYLVADDEGRTPADPAFLNGTVFWGVVRPVGEVEQALAGLAAAKLIALYAVDGASYLQIAGWTEKGSVTHQKIDRPSPARFPARPDGADQSAPARPSNFDAPPQSKLETLARDIAAAAVDAVNRIGRRTYAADSVETLKLCRALARDGLTPELVVAAVSHVAKPWVGHATFDAKIRPATLLQAKRVRDALDDIGAGNGGAGRRETVAKDSGQIVLNGAVLDAPGGGQP